MRFRIVLLIALALIAAACGGTSKTTAESETVTRTVQLAKPTQQRPSAVPADTVAGDLIMTKFTGATPTADELAAIRSRNLGGVILFGWNVQDEAQLTKFTAALQSARKDPKSPVLVSVDQEGGAIRNVPFAPPDQTQPQLSSGSPDEAQRVGEQTGAALEAVGVNMDLGPVSDLASPPNRTMAGRAFGSDAEQVAPFVASTVTGMLAGGVIPTPKHFPGFGASTENSDNGIAYVDRTRAELQASELRTFRAAIAAKTPAIMVSHGIMRELGSTLPGTVDPMVSTKLLRDELGFEGVAITDSMNAKGFRDAWGRTVPQACPAAIAAGIDLLLLTGSLETATLCRKRILAALADGSLPRARFDQAVCRVTVLRETVASGHMTDMSFSSCSSDEPSPDATAARPAT